MFYLDFHLHNLFTRQGDSTCILKVVDALNEACLEKTCMEATFLELRKYGWY